MLPQQPAYQPAGLHHFWEGIEPSQVGLQLSWLRGLSGARLIEGQVAEGKAGLTSPAALVEVTVEGEPVQRLRIGNEVPAAAGGAPCRMGP